MRGILSLVISTEAKNFRIIFAFWYYIKNYHIDVNIDLGNICSLYQILLVTSKWKTEFSVVLER